MGIFGGDQKVKTSTAPWKPAAPYLQEALGGAKKLFAQGAFAADPYSGLRVANPSGATQAGWNSILGTASGGVPGLGAAQHSLSQIMRGNVPYADMEKNDPRLIQLAEGSPVLARMMSGGDIYRQLGRVKDEALGSAIPAAVSMFSGSGMTNSTTAMDNVGRAATEAVAPIDYQAWQTAQDRALAAQGQDVSQRLAAIGQNADTRLAAAGLGQSGALTAAGMVPQLAATSYLPGQMMGAVGAQRDAVAQNRINANMQEHYENEDWQKNNFQSYLNTLLGIGGTGSTGTQSGGGPSGAASLAGAGLGGLGAYGALAANPATAPFAIGGGLLAGLMGIL